MVIKMLTKLGRKMDNHSENFYKRRYKKVPNRNHRADEYNNHIEKIQ